MKIRRLNEQGIRLFADFIRNAKQDERLQVPTGYLTDDETSEAFSTSIDIENRDIHSRLLAGSYLYELLGAVSETNVDTDEGLWAWLSLYFFEQLCPPSNNKRKISDQSTLIPDPHNHQRYYRHLLAGPFFIYRLYADDPDIALSLLCQPIETPGAVVEEVASRPELVTNRDFVSLITQLYYDPETNTLRRGSGGKGGGSARRLAKNIHGQLERTWDLKSVGTDRFLELLPGEFNRFKNG
ncbi:MAG: hypothetical protein ACPGJU_07905 [Coraliomargarita sp.]